MDERDPQARPFATDHLPPYGHLRRAAEAHRERVPGGIGISGTERGKPGGITRQHPYEIGVDGQRPQHRIPRPVDEPAFHHDRLDSPERIGTGESGLDPRLQAADERMQAVGQERDQCRPGIGPDHVEFVGPEHRQRERMGKQQCAARLHERPHAGGTGVGPAVATDEDGIADPRIEEWFPGRVAGHVGSHQIGQWARGGEIAADTDRIATGGGG